MTARAVKLNIFNTRHEKRLNRPKIGEKFIKPIFFQIYTPCGELKKVRLLTYIVNSYTDRKNEGNGECVKETMTQRDAINNSKQPLDLQ